MKIKIKILLTLLIGLNANAAVYYVAPTGGNDNNNGLIEHPWATWQKAFNTAQAGDTVYFRGGTWYPTSVVHGNNITEIDPKGGRGHNGEPGNPICFFAYPGETPILDCKYVYPPLPNPNGNGYLAGISINDAHWINWKGLTIRNVYQRIAHYSVTGIGGYAISNMTFEKMTVHNIGGVGYNFHSVAGLRGYGFGWDNKLGYVPYDTVRYINCDAYQCCDSLPAGIGNYAGNMGDGFKHIAPYPEGHIIYEGCRAWHCVDDGFDNGMHYCNNNWSFNNDYSELDLEQQSSGFKPGTAAGGIDNRINIFKNNLIAFCSGSGIQPVMYETFTGKFRFYNNTIYKCGIGVFTTDYTGEGIPDIVFRNNIIYKPLQKDAGGRPYIHTHDKYYEESNNTWIYAEAGSLPNWDYHPTIKVTDDDFVLVDKEEALAQLTAPRKPDGSLPDITFMKLKAGSQLIDAGTQIPVEDGSGVVLEYYGNAPDLGYAEYNPYTQIIADHTIVDDYDKIPQYYIDEVKKMYLAVPGRSHSEGYYTGLLLLQQANPKFAVNVTRSGTPESYTSLHLRASGAMWGNYESSTGWQYDIDSRDWAGGIPYNYIYNPTQAARVMAGLAYAHNNNLTMSSFGYGYCYDDGWVDSYITATQAYNDYCVNNNIPTRVFFTTGPADSYMSQSSEAAYLSSLRWDAIRNHVEQDSTLILFDYNDILSYNDNNQLATQTWNGHTYQVIHPDNMEGGVGSWYSGHIGGNGCLRLGKAMWWMLARMAGWDGTYEGQQSSAKNIISFSLPQQTDPATINTTTHTVNIEVAHGTNVTNLTPTISISAGATINPASGVARNFSTPQTYIVTAEDESIQTWTVTVTVAGEEPEPGEGRWVPYVKDGEFVIRNNRIVVKYIENGN